jgi:hypothetical protein
LPCDTAIFVRFDPQHTELDMYRLIVLGAVMFTGAVFAADTVEERLAVLERIVLEMRQELELKDAEIVGLRSETAELKEALASKSTVAESEGHDGHDHSGHNHGGHMRLGEVEFSAALNISAGGSTASDAELETLQGGGHDSKRGGFTFNQLELVAAGDVGDGRLEAHAVLLEDEVEVEEVFADYPLAGDWDIRAGYFLTPFGLHNQKHLHSLDWQDQSIINTRIFGSEGQRGMGVSLGTSLPVGWKNRFQLSVQQASGDFMASFDGNGLAHAHGDDHGAHGDEHDEDHEDDHEGGREEHEEEEHAHAAFEGGIGGRPLGGGRDVDGLGDFTWTVRWAHDFELDNDLAIGLGSSAAYGQNHAGGHTVLWGADLTIAQPDRWLWRTEVIGRSFDADALTLEGDDPMDTDDDLFFAADTLDDWGFYSEFQYWLNTDWIIGMRGEFASGSGGSYDEEGDAISRDQDPFRGDRMRLSPNVTWKVDEGVRLRLQYNYDDADYLDDGEAHTLWLGAEWLLGGHEGHNH